MYRHFYGLNERPFNLTPDPRFLFLSENHRGALEHLIYGIRQREGFIAITGDVGTGKTTLCRALLEKLDPKTKSALVLNPLLSEEELLRAILQDFGVPSRAQSKKGLIDDLNGFLLGQLGSGSPAVLIVDEAQDLSLPVLEQLRILSNLETTKEKLLQIVLMGQNELRDKLALPALRQLNQRISVRYHIRPLQPDEVPRYILHRLMVAGARGGVSFSQDALERISRESQGIPRLINLICDRALLAGYVERARTIGASLVDRAVQSLQGEAPAPPRAQTRSRRWPAAAGIGGAVLVASLLILGVWGGWFEWSAERSTAPASSRTAASLARDYVFDESFPYTITVSRLEAVKDVVQTVRKLEALGIEVYLWTQEAPGQPARTWVFVGKFKTRPEAEQARAAFVTKTGVGEAEVVAVQGLREQGTAGR
ncbi:MAG: AAA family ATPase [Deltaproteobacteria bacterium]|nr:AAA family ATPase [Deltaproteobacteria bacterium]MBI3076034.1 AAA family ATPase [Deltaproteobacteria bacterium]